MPSKKLPVKKMPLQKPKQVEKSVVKATPKPAAKVEVKPAAKAPAKTPVKPAAKSEVKKPAKPTAAQAKEDAKAAAKAAAIAAAKGGRKPNAGKSSPGSDDADMSDIEADLVGDPIAAGEKVKPLRMKISKAKERALMKEFGLDDTILSEEDMAKRRQKLKALIKLGKTRGYLTHGEISDHLPGTLHPASQTSTLGFAAERL